MTSHPIVPLDLQRSDGRRRQRAVEDWLLLLLGAEKSVQHALVTWAFASDRFGLRDQVALPYEILLVVGGISAVLFAIAVVGVWRRRRWAPPLLLVPALVDLVGEFAAQGTLMIQIGVSFIVALAVLALALRARRRFEVPEVTAANSDSPRQSRADERMIGPPPERHTHTS